MKCCDNEKELKHENNHRGHMSHILMMVLCCGAPFIFLLMLPIIGNINPGIKTLIFTVLPFLCPIMMIIMMPMMFKGNKEKQKDGNTPEELRKN